MHEHIRIRCVRLGKQFIDTGETVRALAKSTGFSKSTIHKDLTERLNQVDEALALEVNSKLQFNKSVRHIRGGEATKLKWQQYQSKQLD